MQVEDTPNFRPNNGKIAIGATISGAVLSVIYIGTIVFLIFSAGVLVAFLPDNEDVEPNDVVYESEFPSGSTPLMQAAAYGDTTEVEKLVGQGVDIHEFDGELTTALHYAVYNDEMTVVELLLKEGASPNDSDNYSSALTASLAIESYDIAALLYNFGADPIAKDPNGDSALDYAGVNTVDEFEEFLMRPF